MAGER
ncbi:hypothetical protein VCCP1040_1779, partial [Vibrio cholerae CP1040(13)]